MDKVFNEKAAIEKAAAQLKFMIPDQNLRAAIFGADEDKTGFLSEPKRILGYAANVILMAFHHIYFRYRYWLEHDGEINDGELNNDLVRVFKVFHKLYLFNELTYDIVDSILTDINIDLSLGTGAVTKELGIARDLKSNTDLGHMSYLARQYLTYPRFNDDATLQERLEHFMSFIKCYPFLKATGMGFEPVEGAKYILGDSCFNFKLDKVVWKNLDPFADTAGGEDLSTDFCLIRAKNDIYYLLNVESVMADGELSTFGEPSARDDIVGIKLNYKALDASDTRLSVVVSEDPDITKHIDAGSAHLCYINESFADFCAENFIEDVVFTPGNESAIFEDFYAINYKYIRNLALAIVDIILFKPNDMAAIKDAYSSDERFRQLFSESLRSNSLTWDIIIAILMIEEGAGKLLSVLFKADPDAFSELTKNLELRFGKNRFAADEINARTSNDLKNLEARNKGKHNTDIYKTMRSEIQVRIILANVTRAINGNEILNEKTGFPLSIRSRMQLIDGICADQNLAPKTKIDATKLMVNQTLATLIAFYEGFMDYASAKHDFENRSSYKVMKREDILNAQTRAQNSFDTRFDQITDELKPLVAAGKYDEIMAKLKELVRSCTTGQARNSILNACLGRRSLLDVTYLESILDRIMHPCAEMDAADNAAVNKCKELAMTAFRYLQTGERSTTRQLNSEVSLKAIFPHIATYQYVKQTGDGYLISNFSIISASGSDKNVMVLSEFDYKLNEKYYCLPHRQRSSDELALWIEPILIECENDDDDTDQAE